MSTPLHSKMVRNALFATLLMGIIPSHKLLAQAATTQIWTGITPPPENGSSYTLDQITGGVWDGTTANWANAAVNTPTSYYAFAPGNGRIANFLPKTGGYTVTLAYDTPVLRALGVSGGNSNGKLTIRGDAAHTITFNGTNSYIIVSAGRELTIGENTALKGDFALHANGGGTLRWSGATAAYQNVMTLGAGTFIVDADAGARMGSSAQFLIQGGSLFQYNGSTALTSTLALTSGTIGGTGRINSALTVGAGATLAPGQKIGSQEYADLTLAGNGRYEWQIGSWLDETAGAGFDTILVDQLTLAANAAAPFVVTLQSLNAAGAEGLLADFDAGLARQWRLMEWQEGLGEPDASFFQLDAGNFELLHGLDGGAFTLDVVGNGLTLFYAPVPEMSSVMAVLIGGSFLVWQMRRRRIALVEGSI